MGEAIITRRGGGGSGAKFATGTVTFTGTYSGAIYDSSAFTVTGLDFTPTHFSIISEHINDLYYLDGSMILSVNCTENNDALYCYQSSSNYYGNKRSDATITEDGFTAKTTSTLRWRVGYAYCWSAWRVEE